MPGLNRRPLPCQGSALPLRQPPEVETGFEPVYTDLQSVASPLGHSTTDGGPPPWGLGETSPSGRRDSNSRPSPWQGDALPTEPRPHAIQKHICVPDALRTLAHPFRETQIVGQLGQNLGRIAALDRRSTTPIGGPNGRHGRKCAKVNRRWVIGAVVARFVHTEEVGGSNPPSPTIVSAW